MVEILVTQTNDKYTSHAARWEKLWQSWWWQTDGINWNKWNTSVFCGWSLVFFSVIITEASGFNYLHLLDFGYECVSTLTPFLSDSFQLLFSSIFLCRHIWRKGAEVPGNPGAVRLCTSGFCPPSSHSCDQKQLWDFCRIQIWSESCFCTESLNTRIPDDKARRISV